MIFGYYIIMFHSVHTLYAVKSLGKGIRRPVRGVAF